MGQPGPFLLLNHSYFGQTAGLFATEPEKNMLALTIEKKVMRMVCLVFFCFGIFIIISMLLSLLT